MLACERLKEGNPLSSISRDLTQGHVGRQLWTFALPFMVCNCLQSLYSLVDMAVVGQYVGTACLSAVSIGSQLMMMFMTIGMGLCTGGQIYISQLTGAGEYKALNRVIGTMFTTIGLLSLALTVVGLLLHTPILLAMNTPAESMAEAVDYLVVCSWGMLFLYGYNAVCAVLRGMGDSKRPLLFVAVATVVNVALDLLFVAVFHWGAMGAALATVIGQAVAFLFAMYFLYRRRASFAFDFKRSSFAICGKELKVFLKLGLPITLQSNAVTFSMLFISSKANAFGLVATAVYGVGQKLYSVVSIVSASVQASAASVIGQNIGAGKMDRVKQTVYWGWGGCVPAFILVSIACLVFPTQIFSLFDRSPEVLAMAPSYMFINVFLFLAFFLMAPTLALINGVGFTMLNFAIGLLDGVVVRIPLCLFLCEHTSLGLYGIFWGNTLASYVTVILAGAYFFSGQWKKRKSLAESAPTAEPLTDP